jgi:hypothetical protein
MNSAASLRRIAALPEDRFVRKGRRCPVEEMEAINILLKDLLPLE